VTIRVGILTASDRSYSGEYEDLSGPVTRGLVTERLGAVVELEAVVPDDRTTIANILLKWADQAGLDLVLTTGGTGFAPRDVTPEATCDVIERQAPGLAEAMRAASLRLTPHAMLSRAVAGIRGHTLIINLPGSPKAARENLETILPALPHAIERPPGAAPNPRTMTAQADLLIHNVGQLLTLASPGGPKRGATMRDLGLIADGAVAVRDGRIMAVGPSTELRRVVHAAEYLDAAGRAIMPGFVDPHTHLVWAGDRADEFEMRIAGASYMEIMTAGGGIMNTVHHTRAAGTDDLVAQTRLRLDRMLAHGTTTVEIKTGYGLDVETELKQWQAIRRLKAETPATIVPTFLGAHAVPAEYRGRADEYVDLIIQEMLPAIAQEALVDPIASSKRMPEAVPAFCDVFCEDGAFSLAQSRRILEAAKASGFGAKIHVDEFKPLSGRIGCDLGRPSGLHSARRDRAVGPLGRRRRRPARHTLWPGPPRLYPCAGDRRRRRGIGRSHRL
jgi:molybdenum cofactor synthesis domain-containing protein